MKKLRRADRPRISRPDAAANARPKRVHILHGGSSSLRSVKLDGRSALAKQEKKFVAALVADLHREPSTWERSLFHLAARLESMSKLARLHIEHNGTLNPGAATALVAASRELLSLAQEPQFVPPKADLSALVTAQRIVLREMSATALQALGQHFHPEHFRPDGANTGVAAGPAASGNTRAPATPRILLLPLLDDPRPRIKPRTPPPDKPLPQRPEPGGPGFRIVRPKDVQVVLDDELGVASAIKQWDSPWRM